MITRKKFIELNSKLAFSSFVLSQFPLVSLAKSSINKTHIRDSDGYPLPVDVNFFDALKDYRIVQSYDSGNLLIMAYNLTDDIVQSLPQDRNTAIFCFKTTLNSPINLSGKNLFFLSSEINSNNISINVTGAAGKDNLVQMTTIGGLNNSSNPVNHDLDAKNLYTDANGAIIQGDGNNGPMNGKNGGNVFWGCLNFEGGIKIISNGGNGGKGQQGANGRNGSDITNVNPNTVWASPNHTIPGNPAENGGSGAPGGLGGNGGNIDIYCPDTLKEQTIMGNCSVTGGVVGESGDGGHGGLMGGKGLTGKPVRNPQFPPYPPPFFPTNVQTPNSGAGSLGQSPGKDDKRNGVNGSIIKAQSNDYYKYVPFEFAKLLMLKAESLYLNATFSQNDVNLNEAYKILDFLLRLSNNNPGVGLLDTSATNQQFLNQNLFYLQNYSGDYGQWKFLKQKCQGYIGQITLNLDFFGNPPNYAPTLNTNYLIDNYVILLPLIANFRDFATTLSQQQTALQIDQFKNNLNISQNQTNIDQLNSDNISIKKQIISINLDLQQRFVVIENLKAGLVKDQNDLNNAITNDGGCGLSEIFHCITAVVAIAAAVYTCGAAAAAAVTAVGSVVNGLSAVNDLSDLKKTLTDSNSLVRKGISDISKDVGTAEDSINKITTIYKANIKSSPDIPDSLIGVDTAKFDETINKYTDKYPEAQKYKDDYHSFVNYVNVTNQTRIKITALVMQINQNFQNIQLLQQQQNDFRTANTMDNAAKLSLSNKTSIFDLYYQTRGYAINLIYLQNKALNYQLPDLNLANEKYDDYSIETLNTDVYRNNWQQVLSLNARNFNKVSNTVPLKIKFSDYWNAYLKFSNVLTDSNNLSYFSFEFNINTANEDLTSIFHSNKKNIKIMGIQAVLNTTKNFDNPITFRITHLGDSTITLDADFKNERQFIHETKVADLTSSLRRNEVPIINFSVPLPDGSNPKTNLVGENFVSGDNITLGVSPFATWKLEIFPSDNVNISNRDVQKIIRNLDSLDLYFWYYYQLA